MNQEFGFEEPTFGVEAAIRMLQTQMNFLGMMWIEAEVSEFKVYRGAHWYFTLKDTSNERATLRCAMFRPHNTGCRRPSQGDRVLVQGEFRFSKGQAQFIVYKLQKMELKGDHEQRLAELTKRLQEEGLFDAERKRPLPKFPRKIGIVTSRESAALQDVLAVLDERLPTAQRVVSDTTTEGIKASPYIVAAIEQLLLEGDCDVIIVTRGGGSQDSLMGFNDERVVRIISNSSIPIVCAIGHQTDVTLSEIVADLRASTPTKAAQEVATISEENIIALLQGYKIRVQEMFEQRLKNQIHLLSLIQLRSPESIVSAQKQRLDEIRKRLLKSVQSRLENTRNHLDQTTSHLDSLGPQKVLERGFALVWQGSVPVTNAEQVQINERLSIDLANGRIDVQVVGATQKETQLSLPFAT